MFGFLQSIASYFTGNKDTEDVYSILTDLANDNDKVTADDRPETDPFTNEKYVCLQRTGYIKCVSSDVYEIDGKYSFVSSVKYADNVKVSYTVYNDTQSNVRVSNVKVLTDSWDNEGHKCTTTKWCVRSLICKVIARENRDLMLSPGDLHLDLNTCATNFVPFVGDWLSVEAKCMIDEDVTDLSGKVLEIIEVKPLRNNIVSGVIRQWDAYKGEGTINTDVYFSNEALAFGYVPKVRDKVVTEVIESDHNRCTWRSLTIMPEDSSGENGSAIVQELYAEKITGIKRPVVASKVVFLQFDPSKDKVDFETYLENESDESVLLLRIDCFSVNEMAPVDKVENRVVASKEKLSVQFAFKYVNRQGACGFNIITYIFEDFKLTTNVFVDYNCNSQQNAGRNADVSKFELIRGQQVSVGPRFVEIPIPAYTVPQKLHHFVYERLKSKIFKGLICEELDKMKPSLTLPLGFNTYEDKFHNLLHLNEISALIDMEQYNKDRACFVKDNEYLLLEVENLSERRPSLIIGDKIMASDPANKFVYEGFVHKVGAKHVHLKFAPKFHEMYSNEDYAVTVEISRNPIRKMHHAINLACRRLGKDFLFPTKVVGKEPQVKFAYDPYYDDPHSKMSNARLMQLLVKNQESRLQNERLPKLEWCNKALNYHQKEAVRNILLGEARPLPYIVFGPPGTGKTITLVEAVLQILLLMPQSRILLATPSNSASDLIATRLINSGRLKPGDLVRLVSHKLVLDDAVPVHLVPFAATLSNAREGTTRGARVLPNGLRLGCDSTILGQHRVTVGTCAALGGFLQHGVPRGHFTHVVVDEAGQATEPEIMIPVTFVDTASGQVILAGDPMQLGPVIGSSLAMHYGLQESYLERLLTRFPYVKDREGFKSTGGYDPRLVTKLLYNYRCLPDSLEVYNQLFYNFDLKPTISPTDSPESTLLARIEKVLPIRDSEKFPQPPSLVFHCVYGQNYRTPDSPSWFNPDEASYVFDYVNKLYKLGLTHKDIGIITPYVKQVKYIRTVFAQAEFESPKIGSVEEFQGQEFNVVIMSTVRSESKYISSDTKFNLGFVANPRRVNVALSRAKCLTVVIGNPRILATDSVWARILELCREKQSYCGCETK